VIVGFTVNSQGKIQDVHIKRGLGYGCDEEAQRVIQLMPKWTPGSNNGKRVNVQYELPIEFELE
jgi:protein TonB